MKPIYVTKPSMPDLNDYMKEIESLFDSHWITNMGQKHKALEKKLVEVMEISNVTLFTNGHLALEAAVDALDLSGEVITTPFTFASTTHSLVRKGIEPVFCDINDHDYTIDVDRIEALVTEKTSAIMPVHIYGSICDVEGIQKLADKYGLKVLYDGAHAFGVKYKGEPVAGFGDMTMFSFHATKVFNTIEGGALTSTNDKYKPVLNGLKNFGITGQNKVDFVGGNAKMNEFQAAMGLCNLRRLQSDIRSRKALYELYLKRLDDVNWIKTLSINKTVESNYAYFPIIIDSSHISRDLVYETLKGHQIYVRKYFYPLTKDFECYGDRFKHMKTPVAEHISNSVLTLPLYPDLTSEEVEYICDRIVSL